MDQSCTFIVNEEASMVHFEDLYMVSNSLAEIALVTSHRL